MVVDDQSSRDVEEFLDSMKQCFDDVHQALADESVSIPLKYLQSRLEDQVSVSDFQTRVLTSWRVLDLLLATPSNNSVNSKDIFLLLPVGEAINSHPPWYLSREFLMCAVCILLLLPLCLPKSLKVLSYSRSADVK